MSPEKSSAGMDTLTELLPVFNGLKAANEIVVDAPGARVAMFCTSLNILAPLILSVTFKLVSVSDPLLLIFVEIICGAAKGIGSLPNV